MGGEDGGKRLEWRDYLALTMAMLQTVALPLLLLVAMIIVALLVLRLLG